LNGAQPGGFAKGFRADDRDSAPSDRSGTARLMLIDQIADQVLDEIVGEMKKSLVGILDFLETCGLNLDYTSPFAALANA
jgi:hypothetical protein